MSAKRSLHRSAVFIALLGLSAGACKGPSAPLPQRPSEAPKPAREAAALGEASVPAGQVAQFHAPTGIAAFRESREGIAKDHVQYLAIADARNHTVRLVNTTSGFTRTILGRPGEPGTELGRLRHPTAVVGAPIRESRRSEDFHLVVADTGNHVLRDGTGSILLGEAGRPGYEAAGLTLLNAPAGLAIDQFIDEPYGIRSVFIADTENGVIRSFDLTSFTVGLVAGTVGQQGYADAQIGSEAKFNRPTGLVKVGNTLYVADTGNHVIRAINLANGNHVTTLAGIPGAYGHRDGDRTFGALLAQPVGMSYDPQTQSLLIADRASYTIRAIRISELHPLPSMTTVAGLPWAGGYFDGGDEIARFRAPSGIVHYEGVTYVADAGNHSIRAIVQQGANTRVATLVGTRKPGMADGSPESFTIGKPTTVACEGDRLYIDGVGAQVIALDPGWDAGSVRIVGGQSWTRFIQAQGVLFMNLTYDVDALDTFTGEVSLVQQVSDNSSIDVLATDGRSIFTAAEGSIKRWAISGRRLSAPTEIGTGQFAAHATYSWDGSAAYAIGQGYVYRHVLTDTAVTADPPTFVPELANVDDLRWAAAAGKLYITDRGRHDVRVFDTNTRTLSVLAGSATLADQPFELPRGLCVSGNSLFVADTGNSGIKRVDLTTGVVRTVELRRAR